MATPPTNSPCSGSRIEHSHYGQLFVVHPGVGWPVLTQMREGIPKGSEDSPGSAPLIAFAAWTPGLGGSSSFEIASLPLEGSLLSRQKRSPEKRQFHQPTPKPRKARKRYVSMGFRHRFLPGNPASSEDDALKSRHMYGTLRTLRGQRTLPRLRHPRRGGSVGLLGHNAFLLGLETVETMNGCFFVHSGVVPEVEHDWERF